MPRMHPRPLALAAALALAAVACRSPEQKLIDRRHELRDSLDELYARFQGRAAAPDAPAADAQGVVAQLFGQAERGYFDQGCLAVGRGERPLLLSSKLDTFLKDPASARACRRAAELQVDVDELERQVQQREAGRGAEGGGRGGG
jgi:hypothetical protein